MESVDSLKLPRIMSQNQSSAKDGGDLMSQLLEVKNLLVIETRARIELQENYQKLEKRFNSLDKLVKNHFKLLSSSSSEINMDTATSMDADIVGRLSEKASSNDILTNKIPTIEEDLRRLHVSSETAKQMNERVGLALSDALTLQSKDITELKSVISAEITARRKFQSKMSSYLEKLVSDHERDTFAVRKDVLHLSESLGSRMTATESSAAIHRETLIAQVADSRNYMTDQVNSIRAEVNIAKENQDLKLKQFEHDTRNELSSFASKLAFIAGQTDRIDRVAADTATVRGENQDIRAMMDPDRIYASISRNIDDLIADKILQQDNKLKRTFELIFKDISDEISNSVNLEAENRAADIKSLEDQLNVVIQAQATLSALSNRSASLDSSHTHVSRNVDSDLPMIVDSSFQHAYPSGKHPEADVNENAIDESVQTEDNKATSEGEINKLEANTVAQDDLWENSSIELDDLGDEGVEVFTNEDFGLDIASSGISGDRAPSNDDNVLMSSPGADHLAVIHTENDANERKLTSGKSEHDELIDEMVNSLEKLTADIDDDDDDEKDGGDDPESSKDSELSKESSTSSPTSSEKLAENMTNINGKDIYAAVVKQISNSIVDVVTRQAQNSVIDVHVSQSKTDDAKEESKPNASQHRMVSEKFIDQLLMDTVVSLELSNQKV
jgi:hypothetical protein